MESLSHSILPSRIHRNAVEDEIRASRQHIRHIALLVTSAPMAHPGDAEVRDVGIVHAEHVDDRKPGIVGDRTPGLVASTVVAATWS